MDKISSILGLTIRFGQVGLILNTDTNFQNSRNGPIDQKWPEI